MNLALGILSIITVIIIMLIGATITIGLLKKESAFEENWFIYSVLAIIVALTIITFTALPSNYTLYKTILVLLGLLGVLGVYLGKTKKLDYKFSVLLITISLLGNFYIGFLM